MRHTAPKSVGTRIRHLPTEGPCGTGVSRKFILWPLDVVSIRHSPRDPSFEFAIAMGVRRDDAALQREVNASLARLKPAIDRVLREYAVARAEQQEVPR